MYNNPGKILKGIAFAIVAFGVTVGLFVLVYSILNGFSVNSVLGIPTAGFGGVLLGLIIMIGAYITGLIYTAFGEIVDAQVDQATYQAEIANALKKMTVSTEQTSTKTHEEEMSRNI